MFVNYSVLISGIMFFYGKLALIFSVVTSFWRIQKFGWGGGGWGLYIIVQNYKANAF